MKLLLIGACLALAGCASTVEQTTASGTVTKIRVGPGNRISMPPNLIIESSPGMVGAGERLMTHAINVGGTAFLKSAADGVTSAAARQ